MAARSGIRESGRDLSLGARVNFRKRTQGNVKKDAPESACLVALSPGEQRADCPAEDVTLATASLQPTGRIDDDLFFCRLAPV